jgi:protease secretion system membrane fusion protein
MSEETSRSAPTPRAPLPPALEEAIDTAGPIRMGWLILGGGLLGFLLWAAIAPLDEGVVAPGQVVIDTGRRTIQHFTGGVVTRVLVKEGQQVQAGETLLELESGNVQALLQTVRQAYYAQRAAEDRLMAELAGANAVRFHPELLDAAAEGAREHIEAQKALFAARQRALNAELSANRKAIESAQVQAEGIRSAMVQREAQERALNEQLANVAKLTADGFAPRNQLLQLEQQQAELRSSMLQMRAEGQRLAVLVSELEHKAQALRQAYAKETSIQLTDVRREVQANREKMLAATQELARTTLKSPIAGQVVGLVIGASGGVVTEGQKVMDIVPREARLYLDAKVPPQAIDRVARGQRVHARFSAFSHTPLLVLEGEVTEISGDVLSENVGGQTLAWYRAKVELTPEGRRRLEQRRLQPGMPAEILIQTGERTMLAYLAAPFLRRMQGALKEE